MLDQTEKMVEGTQQAGIFTNNSGSYGVVFKGDKVDMFGSDIESARKSLKGLKGE